ncbi:LysM peptidoglycan-binding domain-containing protein [Niallia taxi]|uniref:LysM peptidoglycan-binding domain-containing protein n=1 Tax=Niallia taxi TaxID=2499688 RepID=UPI0015F4852A|nr:LysM peptidoglycan-binding domain-containing protein [Niallia taxi]
MDNFQRYELKKLSPQNDEFALVLYLDDQLTEFANELGTTPTAKSDMLTTARQILRERYPKVKVTMVKVILGGLVVTSIPLASDASSASAAEPNGTTSAQTSQVDGNSIHHQVVAGDTLWNLSVKYKTSVDNIKRANNLTSDVLKLGQQLIMPKAFHTVGTGDYLTVLAKKYGVTVDSIKQANGLTSDATRLGQTLIIPMVIGATSTTTPIPAPTEQAPTQSQSTTYVVVAGDSLSVIAKRFGTTVEALRSENQLTSDLLRIGQSLTIPGTSTAVPPTETAPVSKTETYTVVAGDSLSVIAKRFDTTVEDLRRTNNLTSDLLSIGQMLTIPGTMPTTPVAEPSVPTPEAPAPVEENNSYTVVAGDNLWLLAQRFGTTIDAIRSASNLTSDALQIGQTLSIPTKETVEPGAPTPEVPTPTTEPAPTTVPSTHTVAAGDNLWVIANRYGTTITALRSANNLTTDLLQIGQVLTIPSADTGTVQPAPTPEKEKEVAPTPIAEERATFVYAVKSGDTLSAIANRFGVTVADIRTANNLKSDFLSIGQALTIPNGINAPEQTGANTITYTTHTVASGDNIWDLSVRYGIPQAELLRVNNLTTSSRLSIGQKLKIPVHNIAVKEVVSERHGELLDWFSEGQYVFPIGKTAKVTDFATGKSFYIKRTVGAGHADSETVTVNDTNIAKSIWGGFSWTPRAVILEIDGRKVAASMSFMPHDVEYIANNGISGHFDVYTSGGIRTKDGKPDPTHQAQVERAAGLR